MSWTGTTPEGEGTMPTPAATVVPLRDGRSGLEVLLLRRNRRGSFGGMWVFPGGKIDAEDLVVAGVADEDGGRAAEISAARVAAVREAREEAAIEIDPDSLVVLSFWMPPEEAPRRFATWFFLAPMSHGSEVVVDLGEIREHRWISPQAAMDLQREGSMELAPPTYTTLWWLRSHPDSASALSAAAALTDPPRFETRVAVAADGRFGATLWAGDAGYEDGDMERPGPRRRLVMDPDGWRVEISP